MENSNEGNEGVVRAWSKFRTLAEIEADLSQPIPPEFLGEKIKANQKLTIFSWMLAQEYLNFFAPGWVSKTTITATTERVAAVCTICIPTSDYGLVCREASGDDSEDDDEMPDFDDTDEGEKARKRWSSEQGQRQYGSPTTRAEGQAFKRAVGRFGLGMYLRYSRGKKQPDLVRYFPPPPSRAAAPPIPQVQAQPAPAKPTVVSRGMTAWQEFERELRPLLRKLGVNMGAIEQFVIALKTNLTYKGKGEDKETLQKIYDMVVDMDSAQDAHKFTRSLEADNLKRGTEPKPTLPELFEQEEVTI